MHERAQPRSSPSPVAGRLRLQTFHRRGRGQHGLGSALPHGRPHPDVAAVARLAFCLSTLPDAHHSPPLTDAATPAPSRQGQVCATCATSTATLRATTAGAGRHGPVASGAVCPSSGRQPSREPNTALEQSPDQHAGRAGCPGPHRTRLILSPTDAPGLTSRSGRAGRGGRMCLAHAGYLPTGQGHDILQDTAPGVRRQQ